MRDIMDNVVSMIEKLKLLSSLLESHNNTFGLLILQFIVCQIFN